MCAAPELKEIFRILSHLFADSLLEVKLSFRSLHVYPAVSILSFGAFIAALFGALLAPAKEFECAPTDFLMLVCDGISEGAQTTYAERIQAPETQCF